MSRIVIFDDNGASLGELQANCSRIWAISDGGQASVTLGAGQVQSWLQFGRMVLIEHESLPSWAGMIDTPWQAKLPVSMSIYNTEYLLSVRTPNIPVTLSGSYGDRALQAVNVANSQQDLFIREGEIERNVGTGVEILEVKPIWEQLVSIANRAGMEMQFRPIRDTNNRLQILFDMKKTLGEYTALLLHDGKRANIEVVDAQVNGEIYNHVIGIGDQSSQQSRLTTIPKQDTTSIGLYRLRSKTIQFDGVVNQSTLDRHTQTALESIAYPKIYLAANVLDVDGIFSSLRLGNEFEVQVSNIYLPGGLVGWRGRSRIKAMAYDETRNSVGMVLEGDINVA